MVLALSPCTLKSRQILGGFFHFVLSMSTVRAYVKNSPIHSNKDN